MKKTLCSAVIIALTLVIIQAQEQQLKFTRINLLEDASIGQVNFITEDKYGFIWMSEQSNGALVRFDGHNIKRYSYNPGIENSLGGPYPECLLIDREGYIWIGFGNYGLDRFDPLTETFKHFRHDPDNPNSLGNDNVFALIQDKEGIIYIATFEGLDILNPETEEFTHFKHNPEDVTSLSSNYVREIFEDKNGTIWVGTGWFTGDGQGGLNRLDKTQKTFVRYMADPSNPVALQTNRITALFEDSRGIFWVGTGEALYSFDRENEIFTRHESDPEDTNKLGAPFFSSAYYGVTFISEDPEGNLWIGGEGFNIYDPIQKVMNHYGGKTDAFGTFIENSSWCIHMGSNGLIWLSTQPGIYKIDPYNFTIPSKQGVIPSVVIESDSITWSGSDQGLIRTNEKTGDQKVWLHDPSDPNSLSNNYILSLRRDRFGQLWIGTRFGLNKLDPINGHVTRFIHDPDDNSSISGNIIRDLLQDDDDILWVGTDHGLDKMNQISEKFEVQKLLESGGSFANISNLCFGQEDNIWIGGFNSGSILKYNVLKKKFTFYPLANGVNDIYKDHQGNIWAAAPSGLYRYNPENDRFDALSHVPMIAIIEDLDSNLWVSSISDIFRINRTRENIVRYNGQDLNISRYLNIIKGSGYLTKEKEIVIGDAESFFVFDPEKIVIPPDTSKLYFTNFWIGVDQENATLSSAIFENRDLNLGYQQNTFSLSFAEIDSRNPKRNKINYRLKNYDLDWRESTSEEKIIYINVPPGSYLFEIKASNSSTGAWVENQIGITVHPPWWSTWWAYTVYALSLVIAGWRLHRFLQQRTIRKEKERSKDRELAQAKEIEKAYKQLKATQAQLIHSEKMASLGELTAGIAHEIQNPLNFINNFSEINHELSQELKEELKNGKYEDALSLSEDIKENSTKITQHGKRADAIVKNMLQHSRSSSGAKELTDINNLCDEYLRLAYHGFRAKDQSFNAEISLDLDPTLTKINVAPQDIGRVLLNLINNAFHAVADIDKPEVTIATRWANSPVRLTDRNEIEAGVEDKGGIIEITVSDNGPGVPEEIKDKIFQPFFTTKPAGQGTGLGLSLAYDIVTSHGGEIMIESQTGRGTCFIIRLPTDATI